MTQLRIGHGYDIHRMQSGGRMILGGVLVSTAFSPAAHSDGDVVLHALVDAILGAIGLGDIGEHFSDKDQQWKGADSSIFLQHALDLAHKRGFRVVNADVSVLAQVPHLKPYKQQIQSNLEKLLSAPANIKAGTNEGCDAIGRGEAIACHAVVLLQNG